MRNLKVIIKIALMVIVMAVGQNVYGQSQSLSGSVKSNYPNYKSPTPGEISIVASTVFNRDAGPKPGDLDGVKECGFNLCMEESNAARFEQLLKYMEGTGLKLLLYNYVFSHEANGPDWKKNLVTFVNKFKNHPCVAGWKFGDEPKWNNLNALKERYDLLRQTDPNHFISFNLVGELVKDFTGPNKTLTAYLDAIGKKFQMDAWSSDYYPIMIRRGKFIVNYEGFYGDLDAFSKKSRQRGIPMWAYCESMEYVANAHTRPAATVPYLSFEAFSALAYGAQGIAYWTYWQRPSGTKIKNISALVNLDGKKTKAWYAAQKVNSEIKALTPVFLNAYMKDCRHSGNILMKGAVVQINNFGPLEKMTNGDKGVLASIINNGSRDYLIIVNHDVQSKQKIKLTFKNGVTATQLTPENGSIKRSALKATTSITLSAGGYAVIEWQ